MEIAIKTGSSNQKGLGGSMKVETTATKGVNRIIISKAINEYPKYLTAFTMYPDMLLNDSFLP